MKQGLAIRESKERRKDCFFSGAERKSWSGQRKVSRKRVGRKGEREEKRVFVVSAGS